MGWDPELWDSVLQGSSGVQLFYYFIIVYFIVYVFVLLESVIDQTLKLTRAFFV